MAAFNSATVASTTVRLGLNTIHQSASSTGNNSSRTCSRNRRLIRFRTTALPKARGVVKPIRGPGSLLRKQNAAK